MFMLKSVKEHVYVNMSHCVYYSVIGLGAELQQGVCFTRAVKRQRFGKMDVKGGVRRNNSVSKEQCRECGVEDRGKKVWRTDGRN